MGFIGNVLKTIFNPSIATASSQQTSLTARDLVPSTESEEPESAVMGSDNRSRRQKGIEGLMVPTENLYTSFK